MVNLFRTKPFTRHKTVGVVGLQHAGKTVLLTSLIDHFNHHDPFRFSIGQDVEVCQIKQLPGRFRVEPFEYREHRQVLGSGCWPGKTLQVREYRGLYARTDWRRTLLDLSLVDLPGERLADMAIADCAKFGDWSDAMLETLRHSDEFVECAQPFLEALAESVSHKPITLDAEFLLQSYRVTLAQLLAHNMAAIAPSSFLLDPQGLYVRESKSLVELLAQGQVGEFVTRITKTQFCGVSHEEQFAPLPKAHREAFPKLARQFSRRYFAYRQQIALPMAQSLRQCQELLVLVDIGMLLEGGVGAFNAHEQLLRQVIACVDPGETTLGRVGRGLARWSTAGFLRCDRVKRVVFIATQADRVHQQDRSRVETLLRELTLPLVKAHRAVKQLCVEFVVCSAVNSTRSEQNGTRTLCVKSSTANGADVNGESHSINVSEVPETWPDHFALGDYQFVRTDPWMPPNRSKPPEHIDLHRVGQLVLS